MKNLYQIDDSYYYVYEHWLNGEVIYVGKGKGNRAFHNGRNEIWNSKVNGNFELIEVKIKGYFKDEQDAFDYEKLLISNYVKSGVNLTNIIHNPNAKFSKRITVSNDYLTAYEKDNRTYKFKNSIKFNHYKQALSFMNRNIELERSNKKNIIFHYSENNDLIEFISEDSKPLVLSSLKDLNKGIIPDPYDTLIVEIDNVDLYDFKIKDPNIKSIIIDTTNEEDKEKILNVIEADFDYLAYKVNNDENVLIKNVELMIPGFYLNKPLTNDDKNNLIKKLEVVGKDGNLVSWETFKSIINNNVFYELNEYKEEVNNEIIQVSGISLAK